MRLRITAVLVLAALIITGVCGCRVVKVDTGAARLGGQRHSSVDGQPARDRSG